MEKRQNKKLTDRSKKVILKIADSGLAAVILLFALRITSASADGDLTAPCFMVLLLSALSSVLAAFTADKGSKLLTVRDLGFALLLFAAAAIQMSASDASAAFIVASTAYYATIVINRVFAIIKKHRVRNIVLNSLLILLTALLLLLNCGGLVELYPNVAALLFSLIVGAKALGHIISGSFAEMRLGVISKIVRKTYTVEILLGLLLLMVAFSFVFVSYEDSMETIFDALWYCFAVVTTTGFGDLAAVTLVGRILTVILGFYGIVVVALITSIIVNFYNEVKDKTDEEEEKSETGGKSE